MDLFSASTITALAASQWVATELVKGTASESGKQAAIALWETIKNKFKGNDSAMEAITAIETEKSEDAVSDLTTDVKREMKRSSEFAAEVQEMAQNIINFNQQIQDQTTVDIRAHDKNSVMSHTGSGDNVAGDKVAGNKYIN